MDEIMKLAIENAIFEIFDGKIPLEEPSETCELFIQSCIDYLNDDYEDEQ